MLLSIAVSFWTAIFILITLYQILKERGEWVCVWGYRLPFLTWSSVFGDLWGRVSKRMVKQAQH